MYKILINGKWVDTNLPTEGQYYRHYDSAGGFAESVWTNPPEPVVTQSPRITKLAFRNRFSFSEKVAIETASETDASVRVLLKDQEAATFIDLSREDTQQGVQMLASKSLLTAERADAVLSLTIQPDEIYRG